MHFAVQGSEMPALDTFTIGNTAIPLKTLARDQDGTTMSAGFSDALDDRQFEWMRERFKVAVQQ